MNTDEIHTLTDKDLEDAIAKQVMGWTWYEDDRQQGWQDENGWAFDPDKWPGVDPGYDALPFCTNLDACHAAEERLKEMGLAEQFAVKLLRSPGGLATLDIESERLMLTGNEIWQIAHPSARRRAEAILGAVQEAGKKT